MIVKEGMGAALCKNPRGIDTVDLVELCDCLQALSIVYIDMAGFRLRHQIVFPIEK